MMKMKANRVKAWACPNCSNVHEDEFEALTCCQNPAEEVDAFACPECDCVFDNEEDALECCREDEDEE